MSLQLPPYWLTRPEFDLDRASRAAFDLLLDAAIARGAAEPIEYTLDAPKWAFLCYAAEERGLAMHGSLDPNITEFEPRQSNDLREFGAQTAVYAAADGIWAMYFAIVDRRRHRSMTLMNACIYVEMPDGTVTPPLYFFSVPKHLAPLYPYTDGMLYLLPRETFITDQSFPFGEATVHPAQLASPAPVKPLAKLKIAPEDFPFLAQMRTHENDRLQEYAQALSNGLPWPGDR
jgi:hypothetical protein